MPLEDINAIVLECNMITITSVLLSKLAEKGITVYTCDGKHMPNGLLQPFCQHSRQLRVLRKQLGSTLPFKKRCWQKIIRRKIINQAECLKILGKDDWQILKNMEGEVLSGDTGNIEANASRFYYSRLFSKFKRFSSIDGRSSAMNYGYAIFRGSIARSLASYGFMPSVGLHHRNELNPYNLADDFIEPFRPIVDLWVAQNKAPDSALTIGDKAALVGLLGYECLMNEQLIAVRTAIERMIASYSTSCETGDWSYLQLPEIMPLEVHESE